MNMTKSLLLLVAGCKAWANTCSGFTVDAVAHDSFRVRWENDEATTYAQVQWSLTQAAGVLTGTIGVIGDNGQNLPVAANGTRALNVPSLPSNTTIYYAAQSFGVTGNAMCPAIVGSQATTAAVTHPVLPTAPTTFTPLTPVPTGIVYAVSPATCAGLFPSGFTNTKYGGTSCVDKANLRDTLFDNGSRAGTPVMTFGDVAVLQSGAVYPFDAGSFSTYLYFGNAPDSFNIDQFTAATGVWRCPSSCPGSVVVGAQMFVGRQPFGGTSNSDVPVPFIAGKAYWINTTPTAATFTLSETNGGSTILGLTGSEDFNSPSGCGVIADGNGRMPIPAAGPMLIRTSALDSELPPAGVRLDPINFPTYASKLAQIQVQTTPPSTSAALQFSLGCLAHAIEMRGIEFNYKAIGSVGEYDGGDYNAVFNTWTSMWDFTLNQIWVHCTGYPERCYKFAGDLEGHNVAVINSTFSDMNFWTPWWNSTPFVQTSSTVITVPNGDLIGNAGKIWFGNGASDTLPFSGTLTLTGGSVAGTAYFEADRSGFYLQLPAGDTATCSITGQTCTVSTPPTPGWSMSGNYYSKVPVASMSISSGTWSVSERAPTEASAIQGGQEGAVAFSITNGPGPYLVDNNLFWNIPGITFYTTGQLSTFINGRPTCTGNVLPICQMDPTPVSDITVTRNTFFIDRAYIANAANALSNGRFYSMRQHWENKQGARMKLTGNIFQNAFCNNFSGRGYGIVMSSLYGLYVGNTDIETGWNTLDGLCQFAQIFASEPGSVGWSGNNYQKLSKRYWWHDNVVTGINHQVFSTPNSLNVGGDNSLHLSIQSGVSDMTFDHNFFATPFGGPVNAGMVPPVPAFCTIVYTPAEGWAFRSNIISYTNDGGKDGCFGNSFNSGTVPNLNSETGAQLIIDAIPNNLIWNTNVIFPSWMSTTSPPVEMSQAQVTDQRTAWSGLVSNSYFPNPSCTVGVNCIANRASQVGFQNYATTGGDYRLRYDSQFQSGGANRASDGLAVGPDFNAIAVHQGIVSGARALAIGTTTATISFFAPDTTGCTVDWSSDGFATWTRVANAGGARSQSVSLTGLSSRTGYQARPNCQVQQPIVAFVTR